MKKIVVCLLFSLVVFMGCKNSDVKQVNENIKKVDKVTDTYVFSNNNQEIAIGEEFSKDKLGKEVKYSETASCAFEGIDKIYTYDHFELTTYPKDNKDVVGNIYFLDNTVSTKEGVAIDDSIDKVIEKYGSNYTQEGTLFKYTKNDMELKFIVEDDKVTSIEYAMIIN